MGRGVGSSSFSAPQAHPVWDGIGDREALCLVGERERQEGGGGRGAGQRGIEGRRWRGVLSWSAYLLPSLAAHTSSLVQVNREREG